MPRRQRVWVYPAVMPQVFPPLLRAWVGKTHLFANGGDHVPQHDLYDLGLEWENDLCFWVCLGTVYGASSDFMYRNIARFIAKNPREARPYFSARFLRHLRPEELAPKLFEMGFHRQDELSRKWIQTAQYLDKIGCQDPITLIQEAGSVDVFLRQHCPGDSKKPGIHGYAGKTLSLLVIFCQERGQLSNIHDAFPVDIWIRRISWQIGLLAGSGMADNHLIESVLRPTYATWCRENNVPAAVLSGALWRLGASLCVGGPKCQWWFCPIEPHCRGFARDHAPQKVEVRGIDFARPLAPRIKQGVLDLPWL